MRGTVELLFVDLCIRNHLRGIEHAKLHTCCEQSNQGRVDVALLQKALVVSVEVGLVVAIVFDVRVVQAFVIHAALDGQGGSFRLRLGEVVIAKDVDDGGAVRDHVALEIPFAPQLVLEQKLVDARGLSVDAVVGAHDRASLAFGDRGPKSGQIGVQFVVLADFDVGGVARRLGPAVDGVVLGRGNSAIVFRIIALHSGDVGHAQARAQEWILTEGFLAASPARVAKDVDVRRPEVQTFLGAAVAGALKLCALDACFNADGDGHAMDGVCVKRRRQANRLGKLRGAAGGNTVQRFTPPVVGGDVQALDGARLVGQLADLFLYGHAVHQVRGALFRWQRRVEVGRGGGILRVRAACEQENRDFDKCLTVRFTHVRSRPLELTLFHLPTCTKRLHCSLAGLLKEPWCKILEIAAPGLPLVVGAG